MSVATLNRDTAFQARSLVRGRLPNISPKALIDIFLVPVTPPTVISIRRVQLPRIRSEENKGCIQGAPERNGGEESPGVDSEGAEGAANDEG
jgi:hypothetical protein